MSSTFGTKLKISVFGQSHSAAVGVVMDGLPAGVKIDLEAVGAFLAVFLPAETLQKSP